MPSVQYHAAYRGAETPLVSGACGLAVRDPPRNATAQTLYRLASVSKVFVSLLLAQLSANSSVIMDAPFTRVVPEFAVLDPWEGSNGSSITPRHLASHMAGLGRDAPAGLTSLGDALSALAQPAGGMTAPAGAAPHYSNIGFDILGYALAERVLREDYAAAVTARVISPLALADTGFNYSADVLSRLATGYTADNLLPLAFQPPGFEVPAGGAYSTARDITFLLDAIAAAAGGNVGASASLGLPPASARDFLRPLWVSDDGSFLQGAPWEMVQLPVNGTAGMLVRGKDGGIAGFTSYVGILPELRLSLAMLWNSDSVGTIPVAPSFEALVPPLLDALLAEQPRIDPGPRAMEYVGTYVSLAAPLRHSGVVALVNGTLAFDSPLTHNAPLAAVPRTADTFMLATSPAAPGEPCAFIFGGAPNAYLTFQRNTTGAVSGFSAPFTFADTWVRI